MIRKFHMCTLETKLILFNTYCSSMYTAHLWTNYPSTSINSLYTAYHNILKSLIGVSKREHTSPICVNLNVRSCPAVIRNLVFRFISRLHTSNNNIINSIYSSSCYYKSRMLKHWRSLLYISSISSKKFYPFNWDKATSHSGSPLHSFLYSSFFYSFDQLYYLSLRQHSHRSHRSSVCQGCLSATRLASF